MLNPTGGRRCALTPGYCLRSLRDQNAAQMAGTRLTCACLGRSHPPLCGGWVAGAGLSLRRKPRLDKLSNHGPGLRSCLAPAPATQKQSLNDLQVIVHFESPANARHSH